MRKKKIALVGGCGFIGHNLAIELKKNSDPTVIDSLAINNLYSSDEDSKNRNKALYNLILQNRINLLRENRIPLIIQDSRDYHAMSKIFDRIKPDTIIHLAAVSHANKSNKDPHTTFDHSLRTLENSLDYARVVGAHFIYFSSSMVYGNFNENEVEEDYNCKPIGIYASLKLAGELMVKAYNQVFNLPYTIIRPSALYGERCVSRRVGQIFIENAIQKLQITIDGDGEGKLDFTYIKDLIQGVSLCCQKNEAINQTFNITFGRGRKINELVSIIKEKFPDTVFLFQEKDKLMPERGTLNINKAKKLLGYQPQFSIENGYVEYIKWYKNFWKNYSDEK
jgi:nucleoside-diphosphate-sugar epimerase